MSVHALLIGIVTFLLGVVLLSLGMMFSGPFVMGGGFVMVLDELLEAL